MKKLIVPFAALVLATVAYADEHSAALAKINSEYTIAKAKCDKETDVNKWSACAKKATEEMTKAVDAEFARAKKDESAAKANAKP